MNKESYEQGFKEGFRKGHKDCLMALIKILNELVRGENDKK
jgi:hypothetical protein